MGLRERNAAQTRELILDTALPLFLQQGYEATTMEEIADRAQIGTTTLYRYFPSKDLLLLEPLSLRGQMAAELARRPRQEPLGLALGHAIRALLTAPRGDTPRLRQVQAVLDGAPGPRARLLEEFIRERTLLEQAVAERLGRSADDVYCIVTARLATVLLELAAELGRDDPTGSGDQDVLLRVQELMDQLQLEPPTLPRLPA